MDGAKPFLIPKREVWEAFKRVKVNQGAAGVDGRSIEDFEANLSGNLYKLWNRMSSGSYFPSPVRRVDIPKASGGIRPLGIPTVADRIAQEVARRYLEPILEPVFHPDSFGYRPGKSAIDAVAKARERCWRYDWVLDLDIKGFFDSIEWELLLKAVRQHTDCAWVLLYIERWLKASVQMEDGRVPSVPMMVRHRSPESLASHGRRTTITWSCKTKKLERTVPPGPALRSASGLPPYQPRRRRRPNCRIGRGVGLLRWRRNLSLIHI